MCGIHASISSRGFQLPSSGLKLLLRKRGPDHVGQLQTEVEDGNHKFSLSFTSTVLALRGGRVQQQPFVDDQSGCVLCWNGEAWKIGSKPVESNDGVMIFKALLEAVSRPHFCDSNAAVLNVLRSIFGPFAFVFLDKIHGRIYYGRDRLGRRSLLYNTESNPGCIEVASISDPGSRVWKEVEADAIYQISCSGESSSRPFECSPSMEAPLPCMKHPWTPSDLTFSSPSLGRFNKSIPSECIALRGNSTSVSLLRHDLTASLALRVLGIPAPPFTDELQNVRIAILFSGGLDCTVLARIAHDIIPEDQSVDLINVAFENPRVVAASKIGPKPRKKKQKAHITNAHVSEQHESPMLPKITVELSPYETCPDRETGRRSFDELRDVCPGRTWRFLAVDIPYTETQEHHNEVVNLIHPHNTEMDLSIAYALYFAARGSGLVTSTQNDDPTPYTTPARVLLSGLGADELFGGYTRHATAFNRNGFPGLLDELELDVNRLGKRNLGRDDRVLSHWSREVRFPYLDEALVKRAVECPIWEKCGFQTNAPVYPDTPEIEPGKKVLRLLAYELGMHSLAKEKKRAIQFGARTAKMETGRTKGTTLIS